MALSENVLRTNIVMENTTKVAITLQDSGIRHTFGGFPVTSARTAFFHTLKERHNQVDYAPCSRIGFITASDKANITWMVSKMQSPATRMKPGFHTSFGTVETAGQDCSLIYDMFVFANLYLSVLFTVLCQFSASCVRLLS